ncbi:type II toxin-antitoxin system VapC family toxin [Arsenicibacter rosenii]|uniref:Twitching motility protein PilT n=1 Tax=Arsenicibacter rosenii TaxID=1750698 RepID=A0A1S2VGB7_9BACT|nr:type II toxin-antitoxin system VapC family toxin [Arsenicibacter rosenii]OIN57246.1 twitching motility protein PilT [Arsenicibacter rosenii]
MNFLLDTHTFIWFAEGDEQLSSTALTLIQDPNNRILVSTISVWKMAIKINLGKLTLVNPLQQLVDNLQQQQIELIAPTLDAIYSIQNLPLFHRDPFDRMLIALAIDQKLSIIGRDVVFDRYAVSRVW